MAPRAKKITIPVVPVSPLVTSWSFSRFSDYASCPLKFRLKHIDKLKEPPSLAMARGQEIHDSAAEYITGKTDKLDPDLSTHYGLEFQELRAAYQRSKAEPMIVEDSWAFTRDWTPTTWNDWAHCWLRVKLDCANWLEGDTLRIRDWKTGKFRGGDSDKNQEYLMQLELYALSAFLMKPHVQRVIPSLEYVDAGVQYPPEPLVYQRADVPRLQKLWHERVTPLFADRTFAPKPNNLCRFCHFRRDNNGPCAY